MFIHLTALSFYVDDRCMAELLRAVPHFNFTWNIISLLVPYLASNNAELRYTPQPLSSIEAGVMLT
jgi:hypothetical protein